MRTNKRTWPTCKRTLLLTTLLGIIAGSLPVHGLPESWQLQNEQAFQQYVVRIYTDDEDSETKYEIFQNGVLVYQASDASQFAVGYISPPPEADLELVRMGNDLTGDGVPDLLISEWTRGAHCCFNFYVFELGATVRLLAKIEADDGELTHFADVNGDAIPELITNDWNFAYWHASFAESPAPQLMSKPVPAQTDLEAFQQTIRQAEWLSDEPPAELWAVMLDLIYTGHPEQAWLFLAEAWKPEITGQDLFLEKFREQLTHSRYWPEISNAQPTQ